MAELITKASDGTTIRIAVADSNQLGGQQVRGSTNANKAINEVDDALEKAQEKIIAMSKSLVGAVKSIDKSLAPDEFTLEFGLKFTLEGNIVITSASAEANLQITMKYNHSKETA